MKNKSNTTKTGVSLGVCNNRANIKRALKSINIVLSRLKAGEEEGYTLVTIRSSIEDLEKLKSILEGGNDNGLSQVCNKI